MTVVLNLVTILMLISLSLVIVRLIRGPSIADRAIAGDLVTLHVIALIMVYSIVSQQSTLIDLVIVTAIAGFISVTVIGIYIERNALGKTHGERERE